MLAFLILNSKLLSTSVGTSVNVYLSVFFHVAETIKVLILS